MIILKIVPVTRKPVECLIKWRLQKKYLQTEGNKNWMCFSTMCGFISTILLQKEAKVYIRDYLHNV